MVRTLDAERKSPKAVALAAKFADRIVGQPDAVNAYVEVLDKFQSGLYNHGKPIFSMLMLGPTGTGKTASAEAFCEGLYGSPSNMMKVDCAEFQHSHEIAKLVGSPPGYLGHRETHPFFTNASLLAARSRDGKEVYPFTVILFDEIEKASDSLWNILLGILDKGTLTTGSNEVVDFKPTVILMTSNVGASELADDSSIGFSSGERTVDDDRMREIATAAARRKFMPEFLNRLDKIVTFKTLTDDNLREILSMQLQIVQNQIIDKCRVLFDVRVSDAAFDKLLKDGYDRRYNARHLIRTVEQHVSRPLSRLVATYQIMANDLIVVDYMTDWGEWKYMAKGLNESSKDDKFGSLLTR